MIITQHLSDWLLSKKKKQQIKSVGQDVERKEPTCTLGGNVNCTAMKKNSTEFLQKIKDRTNIRSNISTPGIYSKKLRTLIRKDTYTIMFTVALFIIAKRYGSNQNAQEWIKKRWYTNIYIYIYPSIHTNMHIYICTHTHSRLSLSHKKIMKSCHLQQHG